MFGQDKDKKEDARQKLQDALKSVKKKKATKSLAEQINFGNRNKKNK